MRDYKAALAEWERNKNKDGYINQQLTQRLIFKSEPKAEVSTDAKVYQSDEWLKAVESMGYKKNSEIYSVAKKQDGYAKNEGAYRVFLEKDKTVTVTYNNLKN